MTHDQQVHFTSLSVYVRLIRYQARDRPGECLIGVCIGEHQFFGECCRCCYLSNIGKAQ